MRIPNGFQPALSRLPSRPDTTLLVLWLALMSVGLVMIASSSIAFAAEQYNDPWFFAKRHSVYLMLSLILALGVMVTPVKTWQRYSGWMMLLTILLLVLVLIPGIGREVNGAQRWLDLGLISVQVSEITKFSAVLFFASYFARRHQELGTGWQGFVKPCLVIGVLSVLLLMEPDFGSAVVLSSTAFVVMFVAGVKLRHFVFLVVVAAGALASLAITSPYRLQRLITFLDPWADQFNTGYQLTQSLIAFGRGEWFGLGLGNSVQKLFYLPEAHTDFIFAIVAEEFGLVGVTCLLSMFAVLIYRMFRIARANLSTGALFPGFAVFGVATLIAFQVFINTGVAAGLLPTKGLTLPFISYGGSSLLIGSALVAFVMRVEWESQQQKQTARRALRTQRSVRSPQQVLAEGTW